MKFKMKAVRMILLSMLMQLYSSYSLTDDEGEDQSSAAEGKEGNIAWAGIIIVTILVGVSILFEMTTEKLLEDTDEMNMPFINTIFSELTTLGFIGLLLFVVSKLNVLSTLSLTYLGEKEKLQETIEMLHMILFMFILIFLILCCGLLRFGMHVQDEWRSFERRATDLNNVIHEYCIAIESVKSWTDWLNINKVKRLHKAKREMVYVALRRRFVDPSTGHHENVMSHTRISAPRLQSHEYKNNPNVRFPFNEYLSIISGEVLGRLIEIDVMTWIALEILIVAMWIFCWFAGPNAERYLMLFAGFGLILLNQYVYTRIDGMRHLLTPPLLYKKAEILRHRKKWRNRFGYTPIPENEFTPLLKESDLTDDDYVPPYVKQLPNYGEGMTPAELMVSQKALLGGKGNGVLLALFCTRMVFLLTAMHLSVFLVRGAADIYNAYENPIEIAVLYICMIIPSLVVTYMSTRIARDGLYAFNVEHMKVPRVITKVMRLLKARQTLRTLRFVAEMKVYLREDQKRNSVVSIDLDALSPKSDTSNASSTIHVVSPRHETSPKHRRKDDPYEIEQERREINTIFCLFDSDGSGSISREEMSQLLIAITHDMSPGQIDRIMDELDSEKRGEITFEDFYTWCHARIRKCNHTTNSLIHEVFYMVDVDRSGEITVDEFIAIFKTLGQSLDHDDVRELVYQMDTNDDGKINLEEFSKMLRKHEI